MTHTLFTKAKRHAERAIARGDLHAAERWTLIMRDHLNVASTIVELARNTHGPRPKPKLIDLTHALRKRLAAAVKAHPAATPAMPVMLDPDGFSPGGTPNWYRNLKRLEKAGLPVSLAPPTRRERQRAAAAQASHPTKR